MYKRKSDGRWIASITASNKRVTRYAKTERQAKAILEDLRHEARLGKFQSGTGTMSVPDWLERWFKSQVINASASTQSCYRVSIDKHIKPYFVATRLHEVSSDTCDAWIVKLRDKGAGDRTIQQAYTILKTSLNYAIKLKKIETNPLDAIPKPQAKPKKIVPFTVDEVKNLIDAASESASIAIELSAKYGLRAGEVFGLQWHDIDFENSRISIKRQTMEVKGVFSVEDPKTETSIRTLSITESSRDRLKSAMPLVTQPDDFVFVTPTGKPVRRANFRNRTWNPLLKTLGIQHRGFHHLRHTAATLMLEHNVPVKQVSEILGHANVRITLETYSHWIKSDLSRGAVAMKAIFEG